MKRLLHATCGEIQRRVPEYPAMSGTFDWGGWNHARCAGVGLDTRAQVTSSASVMRSPEASGS